MEHQHLGSLDLIPRQVGDSHPIENWGFGCAVLANLQSHKQPAWSQMATRCREEVELHYSNVQRSAWLILYQLLEMLIQKFQEYRKFPGTFKFSWGPSSFPQIEAGRLLTEEESIR